MRIVLYDEDQATLRSMTALLGGRPGVEVAAATGNPSTTLRLIAETRPDLVVLAIGNDGPSGLKIAARLDGAAVRPRPLVAFVTSDRRLACEAFDYGALDCLAKPVRARRLDVTIARAHLALEGARAGSPPLEPLSSVGSGTIGCSSVEADHVWVARRGERVRVDLDLVQRVSAEGAYVRLHLAELSYLHRSGIGAIAESLDARLFARVHRSHVVRFDQILAIRRTVHGAGELFLRGGGCVPLGRMFASEVRRRLLLKAKTGSASIVPAVVPARERTSACSCPSSRPARKS